MVVNIIYVKWGQLFTQNIIYIYIYIRRLLSYIHISSFTNIIYICIYIITYNLIIILLFSFINILDIFFLVNLCTRNFYSLV